MVTLNLSFSSVSELKQWLKEKNYELDSPEEFYDWLCDFFESGNTITVDEEEYDYWDCWEMV